MKNILYIIGVILLFFCCNPSRKTVFNKEQISFITNFCTDSNTYYDIEKKDSTIQYYFKITSIESSLNNKFVYILNGECSVCISYLAKFIYYLKEANIEIPITVITSQKDAQNIKYYMQQFDIPQKNNLSYKEIPENQYAHKLEYYARTNSHLCRDHLSLLFIENDSLKRY